MNPEIVAMLLSAVLIGFGLGVTYCLFSPWREWWPELSDNQGNTWTTSIDTTGATMIAVYKYSYNQPAPPAAEARER